MASSKYDVFLCYHTGGGTDFAIHLWKKLPDYGKRAFFNIEDVDEIYEKESDEYRKVIDDAIINSEVFILLMTRSFKDRAEIQREYKLARDTGRKIIHCKYVNLEKKDCIMNIEEKIYNLYDIDYVEFSNNSNLYNGVTDVLEGKTPPKISNIDPLKKELFDKFFEPIYADIASILDRYDNNGYESNHYTRSYDNYGGPLRIKLRKFHNIGLKRKINEFYRLSDTRGIKLNYYDRSANKIINEVITNYIEDNMLDWKPQKTTNAFISVEVEIEYIWEDTSIANTVLSFDLLYKELGSSLMRNRNNKSVKLSRVLFSSDGGADKIIPNNVFCDLWSHIIKMSNEDENIAYIRESYEKVKLLGTGILKDIEAEFSDFY